MKYILTILAAILLFSACNPVKKVLKSPEKTEQVVSEYLDQHPPKNDTTFIPGRDTTILHERVVRDSIPLPYPVNHRYTEIRYQDRLVTDTITIDHREFMELQDKRIRKLEINLETTQDRLKIWIALAICTWVLNALVLVVFILLKRGIRIF